MKLSLNFSFSEFDTIRKEVRNKMSDEEFFTPSLINFCENTIKQFELTEKFKTQENWIELASRAIVENVYEEGVLEKELGEEFQKDNKVSPLELLLEHFWGFEKVPGVEYLRLKNLVERDLSKIDELITKYETDYPYLLTDDIRNHEQGTIKSFYERCKNEKDKITNHLLNGIKARAEDNCVKYGYLDSLSFAFFQERLDRPYDLPLFKVTFFDREKINLFQHRLDFIEVRDAKKIGELYSSNKEEFYKKIEKDFHPDLLIRYLNWIPDLKNNRRLVFKELKELYDEQKYWSFIGLGIPQIEGLFADMSILIKGKEHNPSGALPDKVEAIREYYQGNILELDYFQFHVAFIRNRFSHYGTIGRFENGDTLELLAKDVLFDIIGALNIFNNLNADFRWLNDIIKSPNGNFYTPHDFIHFFNLIDSVKKIKLYEFFESELLALRLTVLNRAIEDIFITISSDFEETLGQLDELLQRNIISDDGSTFKLDDWDRKRIATNKEQVKALFQDFFNGSFQDEIDKILVVGQFVGRYKKYIDSSELSTDTEMYEESFNSTYSEKIQAFKFISEIMNHNIRL